MNFVVRRPQVGLMWRLEERQVWLPGSPQQVVVHDHRPDPPHGCQRDGSGRVPPTAWRDLLWVEVRHNPWVALEQVRQPHEVAVLVRQLEVRSRVSYLKGHGLTLPRRLRMIEQENRPLQASIGRLKVLYQVLIGAIMLAVKQAST